MRLAQDIVIAAEDAEQRLDRWLRRRYPVLNQGRIEKLLRSGQVRVDGVKVKANHRLTVGMSVRLPPPDALAAASAQAAALPQGAPHPLTEADRRLLRDIVLWQDPHVLAVNKPHGLAVQGGSGTRRHLDGLLQAAAEETDAPRPLLVHRLDRDTSGVMLLGKSAAAARQLAEAFRGRSVRKIYLAIVQNVPELSQGRIRAPIGKVRIGGEERMAVTEDGQSADTLYSVIDHAGRSAALVALWPRTGRTHQLRVHMAHIGCPIFGDGKYGLSREEQTLGDVAEGQMLHLHAARIVMPYGRRAIDVSAPLPPHMKRSCASLGFEAGRIGDPFEDFSD